MGRRRPVVLGVILLGATLRPATAPAQSVPGFTVSLYAPVADPTLLAFDSLGNAYVGRDAGGSGGGPSDAVKIHRIGVGGSPVEEYGDTAIPDPDTVLVDETGTISGVAGSVLVGGAIDAGSTQGQISAIRPDQTVVVVFGPTATFRNPNQLAFDSNHRLLFADTPTAQVLVSTGATPTSLFTVANPIGRVTVDAGDRIFTSDNNGNVRIHDSTGTLVNDAFATGLGVFPTLAFAPGNEFGSGLYVLSRANGDLLSFDAGGTPTVVGTGFDVADTITFGPDGALYVAEFNNDRVLRVVPTPTTTTTSSTSTTTSSSTSTSTSTSSSTSTTSTSTTSTTVTTSTTSSTVPPVCVGGTTISHAVLVIQKVGPPLLGDERLLLAGTGDFPLGVPGSFAPAATGAQLLLEDLAGTGATLLDLTYRTTPIPPGPTGTQCGPRDGWKGMRYRNASNQLGAPTCAPGSADGLTLLRFRDRRARGRGIPFMVRTKGSVLPPVTGPLRVTLVLGATSAESLGGECSVHTFTADRCTLKRGTFRCR